VDQQQQSDEEIGDAEEQEVVVLDQPAGVPGDEEDRAGHHHAEEIDERVKEEVAVAGRGVEAEQHPRPGGQSQHDPLAGDRRGRRHGGADHRHRPLPLPTVSGASTQGPAVRRVIVEDIARCVKAKRGGGWLP
jgi:hypothetical protein